MLLVVVLLLAVLLLAVLLVVVVVVVGSCLLVKVKTEIARTRTTACLGGEHWRCTVACARRNGW